MNNASNIAIECGVDDLPLWRDPDVHATVSALLHQHGFPTNSLPASFPPTVTMHTNKEPVASTMISMPS